MFSQFSSPVYLPGSRVKSMPTETFMPFRPAFLSAPSELLKPHVRSASAPIDLASSTWPQPASPRIFPDAPKGWPSERTWPELVMSTVGAPAAVAPLTSRASCFLPRSCRRDKLHSPPRLSSSPMQASSAVKAQAGTSSSSAAARKTHAAMAVRSFGTIGVPGERPTCAADSHMQPQ